MITSKEGIYVNIPNTLPYVENEFKKYAQGRSYDQESDIQGKCWDDNTPNRNEKMDAIITSANLGKDSRTTL